MFDTNIIIELAFATYKAEPNNKSALIGALNLLHSYNILDVCNPEVLEMAGDIEYKLFILTEDEAYLNKSIYHFEKSYYTNSQVSNGIYLSYLLSYKAAFLKDKIIARKVDWACADRINKRLFELSLSEQKEIIDYKNSLEEINIDDEDYRTVQQQKRQAKEDYLQLLLNESEAHFALNGYEKYKKADNEKDKDLEEYEVEKLNSYHNRIEIWRKIRRKRMRIKWRGYFLLSLFFLIPSISCISWEVYKGNINNYSQLYKEQISKLEVAIKVLDTNVAQLKNDTLELSKRLNTLTSKYENLERKWIDDSISMAEKWMSAFTLSHSNSISKMFFVISENGKKIPTVYDKKNRKFSYSFNSEDSGKKIMVHIFFKSISDSFETNLTNNIIKP